MQKIMVVLYQSTVSVTLADKNITQVLAHFILKYNKIIQQKLQKTKVFNQINNVIVTEPQKKERSRDGSVQL